MHISTVSSIHCCAVSVSIFFFTQCRHRNTRELIHSSILNWCIHSSNGNEEKKSFVIAYNCRLHISNKISRKKNKTKIKIFHTNELIPLNQVISNWNIVCLLGLMGILFFFFNYSWFWFMCWFLYLYRKRSIPWNFVSRANNWYMFALFTMWRKANWTYTPWDFGRKANCGYIYTYHLV